jgi:hypothetical protein
VRWRTNFDELEPGATPEALARLSAAAPALLPNSFYVLLAFANGGSWPAGAGQFSFRLSSAECIAESCAWEPRKPNAAHEFLRGFILIGANGSGACVGFDIRGAPPWPIVEIDMAADPDERIVAVAKDFDAFLELLGI